MLEFKELVEKSRSYRIYDSRKKVDIGYLKELVNIARISSSSRNIQALKYVVIHSKQYTDLIFDNIKFASNLDWNGPNINQRPPAYILVVIDKNIAHSKELYTYALVDAGIAMQNIRLAIVSSDYSGCTFGSIKRDVCKEALNLDKNHDILCAISIGKGNEQIELTDVKDNQTSYYHKDDIHYVPKRKLEEILIDVY